MVFCVAAVCDEACTRLADLYARPGKVLAQALVVFEETAELELRHGLAAAGSGRHGSSSGCGGGGGVQVLALAARKLLLRPRGRRLECG